MYGNVTAGAALPATGLAFTGLNVGWISLSAFVLIMAGVAILAILPRRHKLVSKVNDLT